MCEVTVKLVALASRAPGSLSVCFVKFVRLCICYLSEQQARATPWCTLLAATKMDNAACAGLLSAHANKRIKWK